MAKYMIQFSYTEEGLRGLLSEGGSKRRDATEELVRSLGGRLSVDPHTVRGICASGLEDQPRAYGLPLPAQRHAACAGTRRLAGIDPA